MPANSYYNDVNDESNYILSPSSLKLRPSELASLDRNFTQLYMTPRDGSVNYRVSSPKRTSRNHHHMYDVNGRNRRDTNESDDEMEDGEEDFRPILDPSDMAELDPSTILRNYPPELSRVFGDEGGVRGRGYKEVRSVSRESRESRRNGRELVDAPDWRRRRREEKDAASVVNNLQSSSVIERARQSQRTYSPMGRRSMMDDVDRENVDPREGERFKLLGTSPELWKERSPKSGSRNDPFRNPLTPPKSSPDVIRKGATSAGIS
jgi:hypothetical protein